ncbi:MAG: hypothetical protein BWY75_03303 [bacterium ADurb.Bin425]|nr:MAG: hypothetical protein BWY75_03303 [bacterium ADurb.Bin425]
MIVPRQGKNKVFIAGQIEFANGEAEALIDWMIDHSHFGIYFGATLNHFQGAIFAAIVHNYDFIVAGNLAE